MPDKNPLEKELAWFEENRKRLYAENPRKWVAVKGNTLLGVYDSFSLAFENGTKKAGTTSLLVKQILEKDEIINMPTYYSSFLVADI